MSTSYDEEQNKETGTEPANGSEVFPSEETPLMEATAQVSSTFFYVRAYAKGVIHHVYFL